MQKAKIAEVGAVLGLDPPEKTIKMNEDNKALKTANASLKEEVDSLKAASARARAALDLGHLDESSKAAGNGSAESALKDGSSKKVSTVGTVVILIGLSTVSLTCDKAEGRCG